METTPTQKIAKAAEELLVELKLDTLPETKKNETLQEIVLVMEQEILLAVMAHLAQPDIDELESLLEKKESNPTATAIAFIQQRIPGLDDIIDGAIAHTKHHLVATNRILGSSIDAASQTDTDKDNPI